MLTQFTVKNYKSFRDEATLDMRAIKLSEHLDTLIEGFNNEQYLPVSVIYGPNGGGKTNILSALRSLIIKVIEPIFISTGTKHNSHFHAKKIRPFMFDEKAKDEPTDYELFFTTQEAEYRYQLSIKKEIILFESLERKKKTTNRKSTLFERENSEITLTGDFRRFRITEDISESLPLLSYLGLVFTNNKVVRDVIDWFIYRIDFLNFGDVLDETMFPKNMALKHKDIIIKMMQEMNLDIIDFEVQEREDDKIDIYTKHKVNNHYYELNLNEESNGTQKLFIILPLVAYCLLYGGTLVIDELDAKIHPLLLQYLIKLYTNSKSNKHGAQLIFTSHDLTTMNSQYFRRDEIWFAAKGSDQNSELYSLAEFNIRKDAKFSKQYLEGKYGGVYDMTSVIKWDEIDAGMKTF